MIKLLQSRDSKNSEISTIYSVFTIAIATAPVTTKAAPISPKNVNFSGRSNEGAITDTIPTATKVTTGAKANTALTREASQCANDSAKAP